MTHTTDSPLGNAIAEALTRADPTLQSRLDSDPEAYLDLVKLADRAHRESNHLLHEAVISARSAGHSWEAIGASLGMSRQAAQQRFGRDRRTDEPFTTTEAVRTLTGLSAFNEMEVLNRAGRFGWHSIGNGILFHVLERSEEQWEHKRALIFSPVRGQLEQEGWQQAGSAWFPWVYYARPTGQPAIMEDVSDTYLLHG